MKKIIILALSLYSLPGYATPAGAAAAATDDAAIAAHAAQAKKTAAEDAEHAKAITQSKIESAIANKNIGLVAQLLPALGNEMDQDMAIGLILELSPTDLTRSQLDMIQQMALGHEKKFGNGIPQDFTLPDIRKKWSPYLPKVYAAAEHEAKSASQKPAAPHRPAPRRVPPPQTTRTILIKGVDKQAFPIPYDIAINRNIVGSLISQNLIDDDTATEVVIPYKGATSSILEKFVSAWRAFAQSRDGNLYAAFVNTFKPLSPAMQIELMKVADYLGADTALKALAALFVARQGEVDAKVIGELPLAIQDVIEESYRTAHKAPITTITLVAHDGKQVSGFDRAIFMNENIAGPMLSKLVKTNRTNEKLPVAVEMLTLLKKPFEAFYDCFKQNTQSVSVTMLLACARQALETSGIREASHENRELLFYAFQVLGAKYLGYALLMHELEISSPNFSKSLSLITRKSADLASDIIRFDDVPLLQNQLIIAYIGQQFHNIDETWLKENKQFSKNIQAKIAEGYRNFVGHPIPPVSPAKEKAAAAGHASPPPPSEEVIPLERRSGSGSGAKSPDSEAALKKD